MIYIESNELYHHGVKGQKWGVIRKGLRSVGRSASAGKGTLVRTTRRGRKYIQSILAKNKEIKNSVKNTKKKDPSKMTDAELKSANARLKLENEYLKEYKKRYPKKVSKGHKFVEQSLEKLGNAAVSSMEDYIKNLGSSSAQASGKSQNTSKKDNKKHNKNGSDEDTNKKTGSTHRTRTDELNERIRNMSNSDFKKKKKKKKSNTQETGIILNGGGS